jgi:hypothetical protein
VSDRIDYNNKYSSWSDTGVTLDGLTKASSRGVACWPVIYAAFQSIQERIDLILDIHGGKEPLSPSGGLPSVSYGKVSGGLYRRKSGILPSLVSDLIAIVPFFINPTLADKLDDIANGVGDIGDYSLESLIWTIDDNDGVDGIKTATTHEDEDHIFDAKFEDNTIIKPYWFRQIHDVINLLSIPYISINTYKSDTIIDSGFDFYKYEETVTATSREDAFNQFKGGANTFLQGRAVAVDAQLQPYNPNIHQFVIDTVIRDNEDGTFFCETRQYVTGITKSKLIVSTLTADFDEITHGDYNMPNGVDFYIMQKVFLDVADNATPVVPVDGKWHSFNDPSWAQFEIPSGNVSQSPIAKLDKIENGVIRHLEPNVRYLLSFLVDPREVVTNFKFNGL